MERGVMNFYLLICIILFSSCDQFYDEEFETDQNQSQDASDVEEISYESDLESTDPSLLNLTGNVRINVDSSNVTIKMSAEKIPSTITQLHYDFSINPCPVVSIYNSESMDTKSFDIDETMTKESFSNQLRLASLGNNLTNLQDLYFIVKAFSYLPTSPDPTNVSTVILCGQISESRSESDPNDEVLPTIINPSLNNPPEAP